MEYLLHLRFSIVALGEDLRFCGRVLWKSEVPAEPQAQIKIRLGRSLALPRSVLPYDDLHWKNNPVLKSGESRSEGGDFNADS